MSSGPNECLPTSPSGAAVPVTPLGGDTLLHRALVYSGAPWCTMREPGVWVPGLPVETCPDPNALTPLQSGPIVRRLKPRYGLKVREYQRIREHLMAESRTMETIGALQQRLKMLWYMMQDAKDLIDRRRRCDAGYRQLSNKKRLIVFWVLVFVAGFVAVCYIARSLFWV